MKTAVLRYPGDPDQTIRTMTGAEFKQVVRQGKPGYIKVGPVVGPGLQMDDAQTRTIEFDEVVCDTCNKEILDEDFLAMDAHRAVCAECYERFWKPYVVGAGL